MATELPDKQYFKIGEVAKLVGVEPYVLRYWESEFKALKPEKSRSNQRLYRRRDVELALEIKRLLYDEGFRIAAARRRLRQLAGEEPSADVQAIADEVRRALDDLEKIVDDDERM